MFVNKPADKLPEMICSEQMVKHLKGITTFYFFFYKQSNVVVRNIYIDGNKKNILDW